jgi:hypothetical protein
MAQTPDVQRASKALDEEIAALKEQVARAKKRRSRPITPEERSSDHAPEDGAAPGEPLEQDSAVTADQETALALLSVRMDRLGQVKAWITTDGDLLPLIARIVGMRESQFLRKNLIWSIILSTIFLIAGWLLSTIATPATLGALVPH